MSNYSKKDLEFFAIKTLENYDSKNPSIIFKEKINITNEEALIIQSNVARLREKRGDEIIGYKIGFVSKDSAYTQDYVQSSSPLSQGSTIPKISQIQAIRWLV